MSICRDKTRGCWISNCRFKDINGLPKRTTKRGFSRKNRGRGTFLDSTPLAMSSIFSTESQSHAKICRKSMWTKARERTLSRSILPFDEMFKVTLSSLDKITLLRPCDTLESLQNSATSPVLHLSSLYSQSASSSLVQRSQSSSFMMALYSAQYFSSPSGPDSSEFS